MDYLLHRIPRSHNSPHNLRFSLAFLCLISVVSSSRAHGPVGSYPQIKDILGQNVCLDVRKHKSAFNRLDRKIEYICSQIGFLLLPLTSLITVLWGDWVLGRRSLGVMALLLSYFRCHAVKLVTWLIESRGFPALVTAELRVKTCFY